MEKRYLAPVGLITIGLGLSLFGEAVRLKSGGAALGRWFVVGTLSLVITNAGIALFGEAVKHSTLKDLP